MREGLAQGHTSRIFLKAEKRLMSPDTPTRRTDPRTGCSEPLAAAFQSCLWTLHIKNNTAARAQSNLI